MSIIFDEVADKIRFEFHDAVPVKSVKLQRKQDPKPQAQLSAFSRRNAGPQFNITLLQLYSLYRNSLYDSYKLKPDLAKDIQVYSNVFQEKTAATSGKSVNNPLYAEPLYHYSVAGSLDAMKTWNESKGQMKCYIAYELTADSMQKVHKRIVGFVHFTLKTVNDQSVVYIAQAGVSRQGQSIGRRLMECVLSHYPAGTKFNILTRVFNSDAVTLYHKRLDFQPMEKNEIEQLGYNERYCGFQHTTTPSEVVALQKKQRKLEGGDSIQPAKSEKTKKAHSASFKYKILSAAALTFGFVAYKILSRPNSSHSNSFPNLPMLAKFKA